MNIALVEDNKITRQYLEELLIKEGFSVETFEYGESALKNMKKKFYNIIILDINLPGMNGYDVMYFIKRDPIVYGKPKFIMLTSRIDQADVNKGLKMGADDYIKKPFDDEELLLRLNILSGRNDEKSELKKIWYKNMLIDFEQSYIIENESKIELLNKEKEILHYFILNQGILLSKDKIYEAVWNQEYKKGNKNLEAYLSKLRKKIKTFENNLESFKNLGYRLNKS